jgi:GTP diphosphokinase / guanosine-3',5'-bis(diphosphate) 3'-diphosphatase
VKTEHAVARPTDAGRFGLHLSMLLRLAGSDQAAKERLAHFFLERFSDDPQAFARFLHHLESLLRTRESKAIAAQYLAVLSPLAEHFGMYRLKRRLDTACFAVTLPREYAEVKKSLHRYERESASTIRRISRLMKAALHERHKCTIRGRFKEPYSVYKKLQEKSYRDLVAIPDLFGFRIILASNDERECFEVLHALHDRFLPVAGRFKDYVSIPKINGYQSLHTTLTKVLPGLDVPVEVQIRTQFMHDFSQIGLSSHWLYKRKGGPLLTTAQKALLHHVASLSQFAGRQRHVYCMAGGELLQLRTGATAADAGQALGIRDVRQLVCVVNGESCGPGTPLADGDTVDFLRKQDMLEDVPAARKR